MIYHVHVDKLSVLFSDSSILPRTALQSVLYDDQTPEEVAEHFKKQGNEAPMKSGFHRQKNDVFCCVPKSDLQFDLSHEGHEVSGIKVPR